MHECVCDWRCMVLWCCVRVCGITQRAWASVLQCYTWAAHVLEVLSAGYNRAYLYFGLVDHTMSSITVSALKPAVIEFVYSVDIFSGGKIWFRCSFHMFLDIWRGYWGYCIDLKLIKYVKVYVSVTGRERVYVLARTASHISSRDYTSRWVGGM